MDFLLKDDEKGWVTQINEYIAKMSIITKQIFSSSLTGELLLNIICVNEAKQRDKYP